MLAIKVGICLCRRGDATIRRKWLVSEKKPAIFVCAQHGGTHSWQRKSSRELSTASVNWSCLSGGQAIQQAVLQVLQVLQALIDPASRQQSYSFRPVRRAQRSSSGYGNSPAVTVGAAWANWPKRCTATCSDGKPISDWLAQTPGFGASWTNGCATAYGQSSCNSGNAARWPIGNA
jgi:hypothetical protein